MVKLMKKRPRGSPQDPEDDPSSLVAYEEFRRYRELTRRYHEQVRQQQAQERRQERRERFIVWAFFFYSPALGPLLSFGSSPSVAQVRSYSSFRSCADARAAGAAPLHRGQPGYSSHLDADGDGIACEWSWRNWFR
jgi:hypothetical protein